MDVIEAKDLIGKICRVCYRDRNGRGHETVSRIFDVNYVPMYGHYIVTDTDDISLNRVISAGPVEEAPRVAAEQREQVAA